MKSTLSIGTVGVALLLGLTLALPATSQGDRAVAPADSVRPHAPGGDSHHTMGGGDSHDGHGQSASIPTVSALITTGNHFVAGKPELLTIQVRSGDGKPIDRFDVQHDKSMHLIIVSNDLRFFSHLHPEYLGKGQFRVSALLPTDGQYTAFVDYVPAGAARQVNAQTLTLGRIKPVATPLTPDSSLSKTVGETKISLLVDPKQIRPGQETEIPFEITDGSGRPVTDLQPYLGAMGHLVIIKQMPKLTATEYLHAHPQEHSQMAKIAGMENMVDSAHGHGEHAGGADRAKTASQPGTISQSKVGLVTFETAFPGPGLYKLWGQFQRSGRVFTVDFTIAV